MRLRSLAAVIALCVPLGTAQAQRVLKQEPPAGGLAFGETVLVDDGSCPAGQIKRVSGGKGSGGDGGVKRTRQCVPRR